MQSLEQPVGSIPQSGNLQEEDFVVELLRQAGMPVTRENYLGLAYPEGVPEDLDETSLPAELQQ